MMSGLKAPELPLAGGCPCEGVRYELRAMPSLVYACHCKECQRWSGSAFTLSMPVIADFFVLTRGWPKYWRRTGGGGVVSTYWFCGECGCGLYCQSDSRLDMVALWGGTLDDTSWLRPVAHVHLASAQAWERIPNNAECFEAMPSDFSSLAEKWKQLWRTD